MTKVRREASPTGPPLRWHRGSGYPETSIPTSMLYRRAGGYLRQVFKTTCDEEGHECWEAQIRGADDGPEVDEIDWKNFHTRREAKQWADEWCPD